MAARGKKRSQRSSLALGWTTSAHRVEDLRLRVRGTIPDWLRGTLLRTGPAVFEAGDVSLRHWFDGQAMLRRFSIQGGGVSYGSRMLESRAWRHIRDKGTIGYREFATDPNRSLGARLASIFSSDATDNGNVNISSIAERFVAVTEIPQPVEFDPRTLGTVGTVPYYDRLRGDVTTAHSHYDFSRQEEINVLTRFGIRGRYSIYRRGRSSRSRRQIASLSTCEPSYIHSFALTRKYVILVEGPLVVRPWSLLLSGKPFIENYRWKPKKGTTFTIIERDGGAIKDRIVTDPFFVFHHVNAFEAGRDIVVDLIAFPDARIIDMLYLDALRRRSRFSEYPVGGELRRYRISLADRRIRGERLWDEPVELARIHYRAFNTKPYRYLYAAGGDRPENFLDRLLKVDLDRRQSRCWHRDNEFPGEPVFVPRPGGTAEDDGVILSVVLDVVGKTSFLLVLDAATFKEIARARVPHPIPFGFHGQFFPALVRN